MLPVCLGQATRLTDMLTDKTKTYEAVLLLGRETDTQDVSGQILAEAPVTVSPEEVRAAAREAQIDDFIMSLPDGYDTKVGSFGSRFSGGEKQRIAIARAILKNSPILILDEATSASDPENQMEIDKAIQNLCRGKTIIVVAHRLSALKMCDRVAVVENHTITCVGTHEEVRKKNEYYRKSWADYEAARNITYQLEGGERHDG